MKNVISAKKLIRAIHSFKKQNKIKALYGFLLLGSPAAAARGEDNNDSLYSPQTHPGTTHPFTTSSFSCQAHRLQSTKGQEAFEN